MAEFKTKLPASSNLREATAGARVEHLKGLSTPLPSILEKRIEWIYYSCGSVGHRWPPDIIQTWFCFSDPTWREPDCPSRFEENLKKCNEKTKVWTVILEKKNEWSWPLGGLQNPRRWLWITIWLSKTFSEFWKEKTQLAIASASKLAFPPDEIRKQFATEVRRGSQRQWKEKRKLNWRSPRLQIEHVFGEKFKKEIEHSFEKSFGRAESYPSMTLEN